MFVDTHAHLCHPDLLGDLPQVVERAKAAGVERIVSIATTLDDARQTLELTRRYDGVFATVGLHPGEIPDVSLSDMKDLAVLANEPKVVAIGETGLDYYRLPSGGRGSTRADYANGGSAGAEHSHQPAVGRVTSHGVAEGAASGDAAYNVDELKQQQKDLLWAHLELAKERRLPVVIHNRSAEADLLEILRPHEPGFRPWGVMHCFGADEKFAFDCLEIGLFISYTGILTFKNAEPLRDVAKKVPLDQVMLETDAPYLAPVPHRGKLNHPALVRHVAEEVAKLRGISTDDLAQATTANFFRLFGAATHA